MENEEYDTIDLLEVLNAVRQHIAVLILCTLATAIAGFAITHFLITPQYESSALMIVNTRQDTTSTVTSDQINSATKLVSTYSIIIKSDTVLQQVIDDLGLSGAKPNPQYDLAAWVLGKLPPADRKAMTDRYPDIEDACKLLMDGNLQYAQNKFNH